MKEFLRNHKVATILGLAAAVAVVSTIAYFSATEPVEVSE